MEIHKPDRVPKKLKKKYFLKSLFVSPPLQSIFPCRYSVVCNHLTFKLENSVIIQILKFVHIFEYIDISSQNLNLKAGL